MQAYRITLDGGIDGVRPVSLPDPAPGPGEVLIAVRATSLNYRDLSLARASRQAVIPFSDGAGEVIAVGQGVTERAVGDRVAGCFFPTWIDGTITAADQQRALGGAADGMLAERVVLPASGVVAVPAHLSDEEAATLPCAAVTAWNAMFEIAGLRPGQTVLLLGTGGVSIFGLQLARIAGVRAIVTSSSDEKLARARALGADGTVNYRSRADWERAVLDLTGGAGVDLVLEVGGVATLPRSMAATRIAGQVVYIGGVAGTAEQPGAWPLIQKSLRLSGVYVGSRVMFEAMNRAIALHALHPVIDRVFAFDEVTAAYRHLESQAHLGKIVIRVG